MVHAVLIDVHASVLNVEAQVRKKYRVNFNPFFPQNKSAPKKSIVLFY